MKIRCFYGMDDLVGKWVGEKIGNPDFGRFRAIGVAADYEPIAGIVYSNYVEHKGNPISIEISCAGIDKRWCNRHTLRELFTYPFLTLKCLRAQVTIPVESKGVIEFNEKLGFKVCGIGRKAHFLGGDVVALDMLREECVWIKGKEHGQVSTIGARGTVASIGFGGERYIGAL